ncbi:SLAM family member 5-like isoform X5 [Rhineura floridana]|uniref:SLAM family member 5-like isoform X5 n=1 Tax=Rhineura floridana TaxID=261503 RepID=UPI002AC85BF1|nr:SLAM family member 5-like isoform X5 [Rhineura floridana]
MTSCAFLLLCLISPSMGSFGEEEPEKVNGVLGESGTFQLKTSEPFSQIAWTLNRIQGVDVLVLTKKDPKENCKLLVVSQAFEGRLNASEDCKIFQVSPLHQEDSGTYVAQIKQNDGNTKESFSLQVYKRLSASDLGVDCDKSGYDGRNGTLRLNCSAGSLEEDVTFSWAPASKSESSGKSLVIQHNLQDDDLNFTCTAENPVSNASKTVSLKEICSEHPLKTPGTVPATENGEKSGLKKPDLIALFCIIIVVVIIAIFVGIYFYFKRRAHRKHLGSSSQSEPEESCKTIYAQVENLPENSQLKTPPQRGPNAKKKMPPTIYTTVQHPKQNLLQTGDEKMRREGRGARENSEKTIYSEITNSQESEDQNSKTVYETVKNPKPPKVKEYNKIL